VSQEGGLKTPGRRETPQRAVQEKRFEQKEYINVFGEPVEIGDGRNSSTKGKGMCQKKRGNRRKSICSPEAPTGKTRNFSTRAGSKREVIRPRKGSPGSGKEEGCLKKGEGYGESAVAEERSHPRLWSKKRRSQNPATTPTIDHKDSRVEQAMIEQGPNSYGDVPMSGGKMPFVGVGALTPHSKKIDGFSGLDKGSGQHAGFVPGGKRGASWEPG